MVKAISNYIDISTIKENKSQSSETGGVLFKDILKDAIETSNNAEVESTKANYSLLMNGDVNLHEIMIAAEKADVALQFTLQIRNKIMDAYNEIMRIQKNKS